MAIVGQNGSGKTTLTKLLLGLYKPTSGDILIDDLRINEIHPDNLRGHISALFQDFVKFQLSVRENIAFGNINLIHDDAFLESAVTKANAEPFLKNLPDGFDTLLGPTFSGGYELSLGQWQGLAISRAFLANSDIIILDEPTASLDPLSESTIFENLLNLSEEKTTIFISHRLGICRKVDRIIVMKDGSIIEQGDHTSLMSADGEYATMFRKQSTWYD
ncbi:ABC transporter ATP-binding protein/permease [Paenibacillus sp. MZ04-78.2]|nr:ABC transporter ATP-binding protein/permease [Paenibacillus sp. MZ04-78.2]